MHPLHSLDMTSGSPASSSTTSGCSLLARRRQRARRAVRSEWLSDLAVTMQVAEMCGAMQLGIRHHAGVGVQPVLVRPPTGLLPGDQAPVRRHEDVARGKPRHHGPGGGRRRPRRRPNRRSWSARRSSTSGATGPSWSRTACSCTAASASPSTTTCTCSCAGSTTDAALFGTPSQHAARLTDILADEEWPHDATATRDRRASRSFAAGPGHGWPGTCRAAEDSGRLSRAAVRTDEEELAHISRGRELAAHAVRRWLRRHLRPGGLRRPGPDRRAPGAFNREIRGYDYPADTQVPTFTPCMSVILEFGTDEQKQRHVPPILKGETFWMQFLSEPSGGSDVAGAQTTAVRDGEEWVLNGSKIWTTGAWWADWGLCLARTNWDVPKHRGLSVFMLEIHQPGIEIHRIEMLNGSREFCQEFITDVHVPDAQRIGQVDEGWAVGTRWMYHERTISGGSPYVTSPAGQTGGGARPDRAGGGVDPLCPKSRLAGRHPGQGADR